MQAEDRNVLDGAARAVLPRRARAVHATESAFAGHLRMLKQQLGGEISRLVVAGPRSFHAERFASGAK